MYIWSFVHIMGFFSVGLVYIKPYKFDKLKLWLVLNVLSSNVRFLLVVKIIENNFNLKVLLQPDL